MSSRIYIEGGGDSRELHARCREGFRRLLEKCGFRGRMPRLIACGGRNAAFDDFLTAHRNANTDDYVALLVDSEYPVIDIERPWNHLKERDGWDQPDGAIDEQALLMTTCMETWIVCDRGALNDHYGSCLQESRLPSLHDMESRTRASVQDALVQATRACKKGYAKGRRSFEIVALLNPAELQKHLLSFLRFERVLGDRL